MNREKKTPIKGQTSEDTFYGSKNVRNNNDKFAIALFANCLLSEGDSIVIDAGTSLTPIAQIIHQIANSIAYKTNAPKTHYSIMTHNRSAFDILIKSDIKAHLNIFHTGGRYDEDLNASFGWLAENAYQNFYAKWVFIGQAGIVAHEGLFCHGNTEELSLKRTIFRKSGYARVILCDWSKIGIPAGLCFGESDKLKDNVDYCLLITTMPEKRDSLFEKIERELVILENRYKVNIIRIKYNVLTEKDKTTILIEELDKLNEQIKILNIKLKQAKIIVVQSQSNDNSPTWNCLGSAIIGLLGSKNKVVILAV